ncbi:MULTISPECIES: hypothetical protein [unclassified Streptomyces]|uniref:hypothetical protein n=1 Tax=unclassified Streptomyces TaxID=2593676 RepID=UPI003329E073
MTPMPRELLPCSLCLRQLLTGDTAEPHTCELSTFLAVEGAQLVVVPEEWCPCQCQRPRVQESEALRAARAEARRSADG